MCLYVSVCLCVCVFVLLLVPMSVSVSVLVPVPVSVCVPVSVSVSVSVSVGVGVGLGVCTRIHEITLPPKRSPRGGRRKKKRVRYYFRFWPGPAPPFISAFPVILNYKFLKILKTLSIGSSIFSETTNFSKISKML